MKPLSLIAVATGLAFASAAHAADLKLLGTNAVKEAYVELIPQFEKATGHKVSTVWASTPAIMKRIGKAEAADLVIISSSATEDLVKQGKLAAGGVARFAKSGVGVAVRAGAAKPDISSADALKKAVLGAKSVAYSAGTSGIYIVGMLQKLGILDQVKAKAATVKPNEPVGEVIARGEAEIGFQQISELVPVKGIQYVGPLPAELQNVTLFTGGVLAGAKEAAAAKVLVDFLTTPAAMQSLKAHGLEPG